MNYEKLKKLKKGTKLKLSNACKKFYRDQAYSLTTVGGVISSEEYAEGYFIMKAMGLGMAAIHFKEYMVNTGDAPGCRVTVKIKGMPDDVMIVDHKSVELA